MKKLFCLLSVSALCLSLLSISAFAFSEASDVIAFTLESVEQAPEEDIETAPIIAAAAEAVSSETLNSGEAVPADTESSPAPVASLYVGGQPMADGDYLDNEGILGTTIPEGGYAHYQDGVLTLYDYSYTGSGYLYGISETEGETYSAAVYCPGNLTIVLSGSSILHNDFTDSSADNYGDGIVCEGSLTLMGSGFLSVTGSYGIQADGDIVLSDTSVLVDTEDDGILALEASLTITDSDIYVIAGRDGLYSFYDTTITDSTVTVTAERDGIYSYDGNVTLGSTKVSSGTVSPTLLGTRVTVEVGENAIFAYNEILLSDKLTVSTPENGRVGTFTATDYDYQTVVNADGEKALSVLIEPLYYTIITEGASFSMAIPVPAGQTIPEAYGQDVVDMLLTQEKEGYTLGGWYTDESFAPGTAFDFSAPVTADVTIYAKWIKNTDNPDTPDNPDSGNKDHILSPKTGSSPLPPLLILLTASILTMLLSLRKQRGSR